MQRVWPRTNTRYSKRPRTLLRVSPQEKMSNVSPVPGSTLYNDGDGLIYNACVRESTQGGDATAYKALRDTIEEPVIGGGDDQSLEFFIHSNDETSRHILQDAIYIHK